MKAKILTVFAAIVLLVSGAAFVLAGAEQTDAAEPTEPYVILFKNGDADGYTGEFKFKWNESAYKPVYDDGIVDITYNIKDNDTKLVAEPITPNAGSSTGSNITYKIEGMNGEYTLTVTTAGEYTPDNLVTANLSICVTVGGCQLKELTFDVNIYVWKESTLTTTTSINLTVGEDLGTGKEIITGGIEEFDYIYATKLPAGLNIGKDGKLYGMPTEKTDDSGLSLNIVAVKVTNSIITEYKGSLTIKVNETPDVTYRVSGATLNNGFYYAENGSEVSLTVTNMTDVATGLNIWIINEGGSTYGKVDISSGEAIDLPDGIGSYKVLIRDGTSVLDDFTLYIVPSVSTPGAGIVVTTQ